MAWFSIAYFFPAGGGGAWTLDLVMNSSYVLGTERVRTTYLRNSTDNCDRTASAPPSLETTAGPTAAGGIGPGAGIGASWGGGGSVSEATASVGVGVADDDAFFLQLTTAATKKHRAKAMKRALFIFKLESYPST